MKNGRGHGQGHGHERKKALSSLCPFIFRVRAPARAFARSSLLKMEALIMKCLNVLALFLVVVGALNWGLWGFFQFDVVAWIFKGNTTALSRLIYAIIGLAGLWSLKCFCRCCKAVCCDKKDGHGSSGNGGGCCKM